MSILSESFQNLLADTLHYKTVIASVWYVSIGSFSLHFPGLPDKTMKMILAKLLIVLYILGQSCFDSWFLKRRQLGLDHVDKALDRMLLYSQMILKYMEKRMDFFKQSNHLLYIRNQKKQKPCELKYF